MRMFRNLAFVVLLGSIFMPAMVAADAWDFCASGAYGTDGCDCEISQVIPVLWFTNACTGFEDCAEHFPSYCEDAWQQCFDHCYDLGGPVWPQYFDCVEDLDCEMQCYCYPIE